MAARTFYTNFVDDSVSDVDWHSHLKSSVATQASKRVVVRALRDVLDDDSTMSSVPEGLDAVVGGPPCQGFSLAGRRNPEDVRNKLPWEFLEFVRQTNPKMVVIENVVGMNHRFSSTEEPPFVQLQQALADTGHGYVVQGVAVNAIHYGAPQNRPRLMIIGVRSDIAHAAGVRVTGKLWTSAFADEVHGVVPDLAPIPTVARADSPTVADAIGDLQQVLPTPSTERSRKYHAMTQTRSDWGLPRRSGPGNGIPNQAPRNHGDLTQARFRLYQWLRDNELPPRMISLTNDETADQRRRILGQLAHANFPAVAPDGTQLASTAEELVDLMKVLRTKKHSQKALAWDQPARTVVTLPDDYVHPSEPRIFTVREMARFQGFPDDFVFVGKETTGSLRRRFEVPQYSQVGNAVSPFLALAVGDLIARVLDAAAAPIELAS